MGLIYKWIEGEKQAMELLAKVAKCKPDDVRRMENIMSIPGLFDMQIWAESNSQLGSDGYYHDTWLLIMYDRNKDTTNSDDELRKQAYEDVRTGRITF